MSPLLVKKRLGRREEVILLRKQWHDALSDEEILIRRPKLPSKPTLHVGFHRVVRHKRCMDVIAFDARECAEVVTGRAGRDPGKDHSRLAGRTMGAFNEA